MELEEKLGQAQDTEEELRAKILGLERELKGLRMGESDGEGTEVKSD